MNFYNNMFFTAVWATLLLTSAVNCYPSHQLPSVRLKVDKLDESYNLFEYKEAVQNPLSLSVGFNRSINREIILYWEKKQNIAEISKDSPSSVEIQFKLNCGARYFSKWAFNADDKIDSENKYLDMDYSVRFSSRDDEDVFSDSFKNNTELSELTINSFYSEFKSATVDCVNYANASLRTRVYIFQKLDESKATFKDARGEYLKIVQGVPIPCKSFTGMTGDTDFFPNSLGRQYFDNDDYRCILENRRDVTHRFHSNPPVPEAEMTKVTLKLAKSQSSKEWEFICSLADAQKNDDTFKFSLHSIRLESCDSPDYCHYNSEHNTSRQNKICHNGEKESCTFLKPDFNFEIKDRDNLDVEGRVTCFVEINQKTYASHDYYFKGISGQFYLLSQSTQLPHDEILQIKLDRVKYSSDSFSCTAIKFLTFRSMKLSVTYRTAGTQLNNDYSKPTSIKNGKNTFGIGSAQIQYANNNVTSVNCHVPLFNSTQWRMVSYAVKENVVGKPLPTKATSKLTAPEIGIRSEKLDESSDPDSQTTTSTTTAATQAITTSPNGGQNATRRPNGNSNQMQLVIFLSVMGVLFAGLFLFIAYCVNRHFTCECLCCPEKSISNVRKDSHILTLMKSELKKFSIPQSYLLSPKDISLDYTQVVGQGQFSTVHQGYLKLSGKRSVLVKSNTNAGDAIEIAALMNDLQMRILAGETNARLTPFLGAYFDRTARKIFIVMKTNTKRNLREFLTNQNVPTGQQLTILNMPPHEMVQTFCTWLKGVSQGLEFLHSKKIVHGNLAAENILVCLKNTSSVSITGFSHSQQLGENSSYFVKSRSWSTRWETSGWRWMPMESLRYMEFSKESDVWSFGVLMWEIFSLGAIPYLELGYFNLTMEFIQKLEFGNRLLRPQLASYEMYRQIEACWSRCGKERPEAIELCGYFSRGQSKLNSYV